MSDTTNKEHTMTNAQKIQAWRNMHPGVRLTTRIIREVLGRANLSGADLSGAYLSGADLSGADLSGADLSGADLSGAYLSGADLSGAYLSGADLSGAYLSGAYLSGAYLSRADLSGADLSGANLSGADLSGANLSGADLSGAYLSRAYLSGVRHQHILTVNGLPSGAACLYPTPDGWRLQVGCWGGTIDALAALIAGDEDWPEATGDECAVRRPGLEALVVMCRAHAARFPDVIADHKQARAEMEAK